MKIYLIDETDNIPYEPTYTLDISFKTKRKAKKYIDKNCDKENYIQTIRKVKLI